MPQPTVAPYGTWLSPITPDMVTGGQVGLGEPQFDGDTLYWLERRSWEAGRTVVVAETPTGGRRDVTPSGWNVRSRVHEYGGGAYRVADGVVWFVNFDDQRIYRQVGDADPEPITPPGKRRYADLVVAKILTSNKLICVCEDHGAGDAEPQNSILCLDPTGQGAERTWVGGRDFFAAPRVSPDGRYLAWLAWDHPSMPWDAAELWLGRIDDAGDVARATLIAGGPDEAVCLPQWSPAGELYYVSDITNWWNIYCYHIDKNKNICLAKDGSEFGLPHWVFGQSTYCFGPEKTLFAAWADTGQTVFGCWEEGRWRRIELPVTRVEDLVAPDRAAGRDIGFIGATADRPAALIRYDTVTGALDEVRRSLETEMAVGIVSPARPISYPSGDASAHGYYYPPQNERFEGPGDERPPLIVRTHGGPTGAASPAFSLAIQFWTSRGFAVLDVDYRGSTGYGRSYRRALYGKWGIADVEDCVAGATHLAADGLVDAARLIIRGGSAGGYTTLAALTFTDRFSVGASLYGIGDLLALAEETHKFEARYMDQLVGPLPADRAEYERRSPIHHAARLNCPVIFLQGLDDRVVPPDQAERMVAALRTGGIPVAYLAFEGEGHGFRRAENIRTALLAELAFYGRILGFVPAGPGIDLTIENLRDEP